MCCLEQQKVRTCKVAKVHDTYIRSDIQDIRMCALHFEKYIAVTTDEFITCRLTVANYRQYGIFFCNGGCQCGGLLRH